MNNNYYVYILTNKHRTTLYIGITNDLIRRTYEHKKGLLEGFTKRYNVNILIYYEITTDVEAAIQREKQLKKWTRLKKEKLINGFNSNWNDLYNGMTGDPSTTFHSAQDDSQEIY